MTIKKKSCNFSGNLFIMRSEEEIGRNCQEEALAYAIDMGRNKSYAKNKNFLFSKFKKRLFSGHCPKL